MKPGTITLEDLLEFPPLHTLSVGARDPRLSPDGRRVFYAYFLGGGHVISKREHRANFWRRTLDWFDRHQQS